MAILFEMSEEFKDTLESNYGVVFEEKSAMLSQLKIMYGKTARKAASIQLKADAAFMKKKYKEAIKLYEEYLSVCNELMRESKQIPDLNAKDFVLLLTSSMRGLLAGAVIANKFVSMNDASIKETSKAYCIELVKNYIKYGKKMIAKCNEKIKNGVKESFDYFIDDEFDF